MFYTVKDVAERTGLTPYTIRYYLKEGLLPAVERNANGTRLFQESDFEYLYMIECMKNCGMTISEIRQYFEWYREGEKNIAQCLQLFQEKADKLKERIERLQECERAIQYKIWYYQTAKDAGTLSVHENMPEEDVPRRMRKIRNGMKDVRKLI